mmetsp:Transcript_35266/g.99838  ORF Transcript_35266/g.99838 Transcript_35266/m.99838 type:complete len:202 (-) Transcript_35266:627-1232(-)
MNMKLKRVKRTCVTTSSDPLTVTLRRSSSEASLDSSSSCTTREILRILRTRRKAPARSSSSPNASGRSETRSTIMNGVNRKPRLRSLTYHLIRYRTAKKAEVSSSKACSTSLSNSCSASVSSAKQAHSAKVPRISSSNATSLRSQRRTVSFIGSPPPELDGPFSSGHALASLLQEGTGARVESVDESSLRSWRGGSRAGPN